MSRINERGNTIQTDFFMDRDRYYYDHRLGSEWKQYDTDQDAPYFGVWVNVSKRKILTYAEGDLIMCICPTLDSFRAELETMSEFYGSPPPAMRTISADGTITEYYDTRPTADDA